MRRFLLSLAAAILAAISLTIAVVAGSAFAATGQGDSSGKGLVYLLRGGFNVFSTGMDDLAAELREEGVNAESIGFMSWRDVAATIAAEYAEQKRPVVVGGHSYGANAAILLAEELGRRNVPVKLVVLFDPTDPLWAPPNVARVINFVSDASLVHNNDVGTSASSHVQIENILHADVNHIEIDNDTGVQQQAIDAIVKAVGAGGRAALD